MKTIERTEYLNRIKNLKDTPDIKFSFCVPSNETYNKLSLFFKNSRIKVVFPLCKALHNGNNVKLRIM